jgi:hypothetical protein
MTILDKKEVETSPPLVIAPSTTENEGIEIEEEEPTNDDSDGKNNSLSPISIVM